jgi:hypothetical protein
MEIIFLAGLFHSSSEYLHNFFHKQFVGYAMVLAAGRQGKTAKKKELHNFSSPDLHNETKHTRKHT